RLRVIVGERQATGIMIAGNHLLKAGLVDRQDATTQVRDFLLVHVEANDRVTKIREARPGRQTNVPRAANHANVRHSYRPTLTSGAAGAFSARSATRYAISML